MKELSIPLLTEQDIDCRVQSVSKAKTGRVGAVLLLYKDARVDMRILDHVFGPGNWQRTHEVINGNLFCNIDIWDDEKQTWSEHRTSEQRATPKRKKARRPTASNVPASTSGSAANFIQVLSFMSNWLTVNSIPNARVRRKSSSATPVRSSRYRRSPITNAAKSVTW